jgi:hypothetical protein
VEFVTRDVRSIGNRRSDIGVQVARTAGVHTDGMHYVLLLAIQRIVRFPYNPIAVTLSMKSPGLY